MAASESCLVLDVKPSVMVDDDAETESSRPEEVLPPAHDADDAEPTPPAEPRTKRLKTSEEATRIHITVQTLDGAASQLAMNAGDILKSVKERVQQLYGTVPEMQQLLFGSKVLFDDSSTLADLQVPDGAKFTVVKGYPEGEEIYFQGLCKNGYNCGISARGAKKEGDNLWNWNDADRFKKTTLNPNTFVFESVTHPGLFLGCEDGRTIVLCRPDGSKEVFRQVEAKDGNSAKVSLESVKFPGTYLSHTAGWMLLRTDGEYNFAMDSSWRILA